MAGTRTQKISATLDASVIAEIKKIAGPRGVSSFLNRIAVRELQSIRLRQLLDEDDIEHGPASDEVRRSVETQWPE